MKDTPMSTYHSAPPEMAKALDRRIWAEATSDGSICRRWETSRRPSAWRNEPRPCSRKAGLPSQLIAKAAGFGRRKLATLRQAEVKAARRSRRDRLKQPAEALELLATGSRSSETD